MDRLNVESSGCSTITSIVTGVQVTRPEKNSVRSRSVQSPRLQFHFLSLVILCHITAFGVTKAIYFCRLIKTPSNSHHHSDWSSGSSVTRFNNQCDCLLFRKWGNDFLSKSGALRQSSGGSLNSISEEYCFSDWFSPLNFADSISHKSATSLVGSMGIEF